jgi:crotonobetainyl-CoA:carnitine CoA-transferase CaiB-like acyl-CoA transferase
MAKQNMNEAVLAGLRVIELDSQEGLSAPLCGMLLAEQGAEVLRVVPPQAPVDPVLDALLARNKTEVELDLRSAEGRAELDALLQHADVVIEDASQRYRVDVETARAANPKLISCHIPAFPDDDPRRVLPGHEALCGAAGFLYNKPLGKPRYHTFPIGSVTSALFAVNAVTAALIARYRTGRGQRVDVSRYGGSVVSQVVQVLVKAGVPRGFLPLKMIGSPFMRCWECGDGRFVYLHITLPTHNARMLELLAENGYAAEVERLRSSIMSEETMRDPSQVKSIPEAKKIKEVYSEIFLTQPAQAWEEILGSELCCIKVREVCEWLQDSLEAGMTDACEVDDPVFGRLLGPGASVALPEHLVAAAPREVGSEAFSALRDRWLSEPAPLHSEQQASSDGAGSGDPLKHALSGFKVLDLSRVIAGPCAARTLAEFGADVISLQSETRLDWALSFHLIFNAGKRSVTLDFTDDAGKETLWKLIDWYQPDAFIHNYRHLDLARTIGVGPETMLERFPKLAYTHLNAYGNEGVWKERPGFEQVVQAVSGIQLAYAEKGRPKLLPSPIIDIGCGLLGAYGTMLSLYKGLRTGEGAVATTHLTNVSVLIQLLRVADFQRDACLARARQGGYAVRFDQDREVVAGVFWAFGELVMLAGPRADLRRWLRHIGLAKAGEAIEGEELEVVSGALYKRSLAHWRRTLVEAGVADTVGILSYPSVRTVNKEIRRTDPRPEPLVRKRDFPGCPQQLTFIANPVRMSATPLRDVPTPPERGGDTEAVLGQLGVSVEPGAGVQSYPPNKSLPVWLGSFIRWGYFAWKSGNI